jgi:hypothetical protein
MVAAGSIPPYGQQHHLFRRTAKDLLRFCLANAKNEGTEDWEVQYLEKQFRNEHITLFVRHPLNGIVAESRIPILPATADDNDLSDVFERLVIHRVLPLSKYEQCDIEWQMPGGLKLLHFTDLIMGAIDPVSDLLAEESLHWFIHANAQEMPGNIHIDFIRDFFDYYVNPQFLLACDYPAFLNGRAVKDVGHVALQIAMPESVQAFSCFEMPFCPSYHSTPLEYVKTLESWMAVARQLRDDATEFARLRSRFEETYLMVEMGVGWEVDATGNEGMGQEQYEDKEPQQEMDTLAFALVPLVDEAGLMGLLDPQSTRLQFVEQGRRTGRLLPLENQFARISILDLKKDRVYKLSECYFPQGTSSVADPEEVYDFTATRRFCCFDREVQIFPSFEEEATPFEGKDDNHVVTVKLIVVTRCCDEDEDEDENEDGEVQDFASVLELWKFLELCLTAPPVTYARSA